MMRPLSPCHPCLPNMYHKFPNKFRQNDHLGEKRWLRMLNLSGAAKGDKVLVGRIQSVCKGSLTPVFEVFGQKNPKACSPHLANFKQGLPRFLKTHKFKTYKNIKQHVANVDQERFMLPPFAVNTKPRFKVCIVHHFIMDTSKPGMFNNGPLNSKEVAEGSSDCTS